MKIRENLRRMAAAVTVMAAAVLLTVGSGTRVYAQEKQETVIQSGIVAPDNIPENGYDVVCVIDNSGSISAKPEWAAERDKAFRTITNLAVGSDIRIGVVYFGDHVEDEDVLSLTSVKDPASVEMKDQGAGRVLEFLNKTRDRGNDDTNIGEGLKRAYSLFQDPSRERVAILFSDGKDDNALTDPSEETRRQTALLEQAGIPIYCVYLKNGSNDEQELKNIVDYYGELSYCEVRYTGIEDPRELTEKFTEVFYGMQNNMQYHTIRLDADGNDTCYLPSLAVKSLRVYLDGAAESTVSLNGKNAEIDWKDRNAVFREFEEPESGSLTVHAEALPGEKVFGTVACVGDLRAEARMTLDEKNTGELEVRFYDEAGQEIAVDKSIRVEAVLKDQESEEETTLAMTVKDGIAESEPFSLKAGTYDCALDLTYEDTIDLHYTIPGFEAAPVVIPQEPLPEPEERVSAMTYLLALLPLILLLVWMRMWKKRRARALEEDFACFLRQEEKEKALYDSCTQDFIRARREENGSENSRNRVKEDLVREMDDQKEYRREFEAIRKNSKNVKSARKAMKGLLSRQRQNIHMLEEDRKKLR